MVVIECDVCSSEIELDEDGDSKYPCSYVSCPFALQPFSMEDYSELDFNDKYYGLDDVDLGNEGC